MRNLNRRFFLCSASQVYGGDLAKFYGLLRIHICMSFNKLEKNLLWFFIFFVKWHVQIADGTYIHGSQILVTKDSLTFWISDVDIQNSDSVDIILINSVFALSILGFRRLSVVNVFKIILHFFVKFHWLLQLHMYSFSHLKFGFEWNQTLKVIWFWTKPVS